MKRSCEIIQMRYSGKIGVRVRYDEWDAEYHCRILRGGKKIGEEHVHPSTRFVIGSSDSISAAASTALERAADAGVVAPSEIRHYGDGDTVAVTLRRTRSKR